MRDNLQAYKTWAPDGARWTQWAKPVMFMDPAESLFTNLKIPEIDWIRELEQDTMIIVDLPGPDGVAESLALAHMGYRPVPLYNGVDGRVFSMAVKVGEIRKALFAGADKLAGYDISPEAPPVFMLDSNRMEVSGKQPGTFDNRWCVFPQDMPSASFLQKAGIRRVIVRSDKIRNDLAHILLRYQKEGIEIFICPERETKKISIVKPSRFRSISYRFRVIMGLTRNGAGGFGAKIPEPMDSTSGGRYYGFG